MPLLVAVTGRVVSDSPLQCTTTTESAVIAEVRVSAVSFLVASRFLLCSSCIVSPSLQ